MWLIGCITAPKDPHLLGLTPFVPSPWVWAESVTCFSPIEYGKSDVLLWLHVVRLCVFLEDSMVPFCGGTQTNCLFTTIQRNRMPLEPRLSLVWTFHTWDAVRWRPCAQAWPWTKCASMQVYLLPALSSGFLPLPAHSFHPCLQRWTTANWCSWGWLTALPEESWRTSWFHWAFLGQTIWSLELLGLTF